MVWPMHSPVPTQANHRSLYFTYSKINGITSDVKFGVINVGTRLAQAYYFAMLVYRWIIGYCSLMLRLAYTRSVLS